MKEREKKQRKCNRNFCMCILESAFNEKKNVLEKKSFFLFTIWSFLFFFPVKNEEN